MNNYVDEISEFLIITRIKNNLTIEEVSSILNIDASYIKAMESGSRLPSEKTLKNILDLYKTNLAELLEYSTNKENVTYVTKKNYTKLINNAIRIVSFVVIVLILAFILIDFATNGFLGWSFFFSVTTFWFYYIFVTLTKLATVKEKIIANSIGFAAFLVLIIFLQKTI